MREGVGLGGERRAEMEERTDGFTALKIAELRADKGISRREAQKEGKRVLKDTCTTERNRIGVKENLCKARSPENNISHFVKRKRAKARAKHQQDVPVVKQLTLRLLSCHKRLKVKGLCVRMRMINNDVQSCDQAHMRAQLHHGLGSSLLSIKPPVSGTDASQTGAGAEHWGGETRNCSASSCQAAAVCRKRAQYQGGYLLLCKGMGGA
ncbi:hypothetical protein ElyMa_000763800 [Elysia marginata]|uniref:Uncharacterized protein n=1 Tax=Elysia marginata TaxID=1093978 RepID=A0AAV4GTE7_9GAST|nr:hypothetical protein ElyMa_000763800 [Elysia marginata]